MKLNFIRSDLSADAMSAPDPSALEASRYSEWHHFTFADESSGLWGIVNLAVSGDIRDANRGRASVSVVIYERARGWSGTMNVYGTDESRFTAGVIDLEIGACAVHYRNGSYHVRAALKDESVRLRAVWRPRTEAVRIENMGGFINTVIVPRLDVDGDLVVHDRPHRITGATGYHDHNWGAWDWSRDLGWTWGYLLEAPSDDESASPVSIVFGQVTDATRSAARTELVLLLWRGDRLTHIFLDDAVTLNALGALDRPIPRVPGVMALLNPGRVGLVPEQLAIDVVDSPDVLRIECRVHDAIQFLIPHPQGAAHTAVTELVAEYAVRGHVDGRSLAFTRGAFAELAGAGKTVAMPRLRFGA